MNWRRPAWWFLHGVKGRFSQEAGAALFQGLRIRLTLWYCGVLGAALVLFGIGLYFGVQHFLLAPVDADAYFHAKAHVGQWLSFSPDHACSYYAPSTQFGPPPPAQGNSIELVACFDSNGTLQLEQGTSQLPSAFLNNSLAKNALQTGQATDIVNGSGTYIYRYALVVPGNV